MSHKKKTKPSSVRHTRAIQRDRRQRPNSAPPDEQITARLTELIQPATLAQVATFQAMGLRQRLLTLPVMMAFALSLVWRHLGSVTEAVRVLREEGMLWVEALSVSQQAVEQRLGSLPAGLLHTILLDVLPGMQQRWATRTRPLVREVRWAQQHFTAVLAVDGSTLDALLRQVGLLRQGEGPVLAGRMAALLDIVTRLPRTVWYDEDAQAHDQRFWSRLLEAVEAGMLLLFDLGFLNYARYDELTEGKVWFITRAASNMAYRVVRTLHASEQGRDRLVEVGSSTDSRCKHPMRLVEVRRHDQWYRYLTNVVDPQQLPLAYLVALYGQRWRLEDAFLVVKRLLGLAYFWTGSINGVQVQVWATWILYAVLVDLTDAVAEALTRPFQDVSIEMVYRGLYHFTQAYQRGEATDPVAYLAAKAKSLGILKRKRKPRLLVADLLDLTSSPDP